MNKTIRAGDLVRVRSPSGRRLTLAYVSRPPVMKDGVLVVKLEGRSGWIPLERIQVT